MPSETSIRSTWSDKWFPALMGGFGVLMGFAVFVLLRKEKVGQEDQALLEFLAFLAGLLAAAVTSFFIESVRARVEGKDASAHASVGRVIGLLILLGLFEIFVLGAEAGTKLVVGGGTIEFLEGIFSKGISDLANRVQLALFGGLWVLLGAMTAWAAAGAIAISPALSWRRALASSMLSVLKGLVLVAGIALLYVCAVRLLYTAYVLAFHPDDYRPGFDVLFNDVREQHSINGMGYVISLIATGLASGVEAVAHAGRWGGLGVVAAVAGVVAALVGVHRGREPSGVFSNGVRFGLGGAQVPRRGAAPRG